MDIQVIPGILDQDLEEIKKKINLVKYLVDWVEIDVLDNTLFPNDTYKNWEDFRQFTSQVNLAAHLMVRNPLAFIDPLVEVGFKRLTAHVEANHIRHFISECRLSQVEVGLALDGESPVEIIEPFLDEIDLILFMAIKAGFSGQKFMPQVLEKIKKVRQNYPDLAIQVDGGINRETAKLAIQSGANWLISTSYLFWKNPHRIKAAIEELKGNQ